MSKDAYAIYFPDVDNWVGRQSCWDIDKHLVGDIESAYLWLNAHTIRNHFYKVRGIVRDDPKYKHLGDPVLVPVVITVTRKA